MGELGWFLGGLVALLLGGDSMVKGLAGLAQHFGASAARTGLWLLAFATAVPELAINGYAVYAGQPELALGNAVGSNIVNIGLTLGLAALVAPVAGTMRLLAGEVVFLLVATGMVLLLVAGGAVLFFGLDGVIARWEGAVLVAEMLRAGRAWCSSRSASPTPASRTTS